MRRPQDEPNQNRAQDAADKPLPALFGRDLGNHLVLADTATHDVGKRIGDPKGRANAHRKQGAGKTGHGIAQQHDSRQHKASVDGTHERHGHIRDAGTRRPDIPNAHSEHQGKKQGIQQHRIAQRRQRKEYGGSDTHALVSHLAIEPRHTEKLIAAQAAHDRNKDGSGHDTQNQTQDKDNSVDDTRGGTGNKARQPRTGAALRCRRSRSGSFARRRLGSRCLGTIGHD